jgi:hypothetical protein
MGHLRIFLLLLIPVCLFAGEGPEAMLARLPESLAHCSRGEIKRYEQPSVGIWASADYSGNNVTCMIHVDDLAGVKVSESLTDSRLTEAFAEAQTHFEKFAGPGSSFYSEAEKREHGPVNLAAGCDVLRARYHFKRETGFAVGGKTALEIEAFGAQGKVVRIEFYAALENEAELNQMIRQMVPKVMEALRGQKSNS